MHDDRRELVRRLFAVASCLSSEAGDVAIDGQSPKLDSEQYWNNADKLQRRAYSLRTIADSVMVVIDLDRRETDAVADLDKHAR